MKILIAGGAGFIGSTVASALLDAGHEPVLLDNLSTGRVEFTAGRTFYQGDIADGPLLDRIFAEHPDIAATVHCAALIVVPDSVSRPVHYYRENVAKTLELVDGLLRNGCHRLIFSSTAALYQPGPDLSVDETSELEPLSPYARTKVMVEQLLRDVAAATELRVASLRYFNPVGADPQLRTGLQHAAPSHALGQLMTAHRQGSTFTITGTDYPTRDGSGLRDYVHVWDLALAHVLMLESFDELLSGPTRELVLNLSPGAGTTVRELVAAFNQLVPAPVRIEEAARRPGDTVGAYARTDRAAAALGWQAERSLAQGIADSLAWGERRPAVLGELSAPVAGEPATTGVR